MSDPQIDLEPAPPAEASAAMQRAVDIVNSSDHPTSKVAACLFGKDTHGQNFAVASTNYWPPRILDKLGAECRIGDSSGTIHAETACIFKAPVTAQAHLCVTDPFCPNCAKNITEAGIRTVYIDHKGFAKDFADRRGDDFNNLSMEIMKRAGINVYILWRKENRIETIFKSPDYYTPQEDSPLQRLTELETRLENHHYEKMFSRYVRAKKLTHHRRNIACALAFSDDGKPQFLCARSHPAIGFSAREDRKHITKVEGKYSLFLEPVNRLLAGAARHGLRIDKHYLFSARVPTSRELVNMAGYGLDRIFIEDRTKSRDAAGLEALSTLEKAGIITALDLPA